jgi:pentatricopeptide repeat protein
MQEVFETMKKDGIKPNEVTYSGLLNAYAYSGNQIEKIFDILDEMEEKQIKPEEKTFASIVKGLGKKRDFGTVQKILNYASKV